MLPHKNRVIAFVFDQAGNPCFGNFGFSQLLLYIHHRIAQRARIRRRTAVCRQRTGASRACKRNYGFPVAHIELLFTNRAYCGICFRLIIHNGIAAMRAHFGGNFIRLYMDGIPAITIDGSFCKEEKPFLRHMIFATVRAFNDKTGHILPLSLLFVPILPHVKCVPTEYADISPSGLWNVSLYAA